MADIVSVLEGKMATPIGRMVILLLDVLWWEILFLSIRRATRRRLELNLKMADIAAVVEVEMAAPLGVSVIL